MAKTLKKELSTTFDKLRINLYATKYAGHASKIAYRIATSEKRPLIISASGDGGYNEVINGAMRAKEKGSMPICAVLPAGNANDHRRTLRKRPLSEAIKKEKIENIDLLHIEAKTGKDTLTKYAHSYIGLGLTPVVAVELNKHTLNAFKETWIVTKTFLRYRPFKIRINDSVYRLDSIIFTNVSDMAKLLTLSKNAKIADGKFEVISFPHSNKIKLIGKFFKSATSGLQPAKSYRTYSFTILKKMPIQLDGEVEFLPKGTQVTINSKRKFLETLR